MAGIDKTYIDSYKDYQEFKNWSKGKKVVFNYGKKSISYDVLNWIYDWDKDDFDGRELPIMNTPTWLDVYLNENCPIEFVKERLKEVYPKNYLKDLNIGVIENGFKQNRKVVIKANKRTSIPLTNKGFGRTSWWLQCEDLKFHYSDDLNAFVDRERFPSYTNTMHFNTVRAMVRQLRKMYLPKGLKFRLIGRYVGEEYTVILK